MKLKQEVIDVLNAGDIRGNRFYLPEERLDRALYVSVNKALECAGGKWDKKSQSHVFTEDIGDAIDNIVLTGGVCSIKKELQYFPTPDKVVKKLIELAELSDVVDYLILEPSAGTGHIVKKLSDFGTVECCEINEKFHADIHKAGGEVVGLNFLEHNPEYGYDICVANPPFTRQQDIDHVNHMMNLCKHGRVVSVMSQGTMFRNNLKARDFRNRVKSYGGDFIELPDGSFKESGTMVKTCIVVIDVHGE